MTLRLPHGFRSAGVHCGIKSDPGRPDLALFVSDTPAVAAGVFTQCRVRAASVHWNTSLLPASDIRAIVVNSGNANACTGEQGDENTAEMARTVAAQIATTDAPVRTEQVLVLSTGIIGEQLPMDCIRRGIVAAASKLDTSEDAAVEAARGMMTTDTVHKITHRQAQLSDKTCEILGFAKGAAMIGPRMATMLAVVTTDAALNPEDAQSALKHAVDRSFNCISVEGHMSTNDTVLLIANGTAGAQPLAGDDLVAWRSAFDDLCIELARSIPEDGEGATHLITIDVAGAQSRDDAHKIATTVANSALVKTAVAGADPNWGRIISAVGFADVPFENRQLTLSVNGFPLYADCEPLAFEETVVSQSIKENRETHIEIGVGDGPASLRFYTTDLTSEYVRLNADYHT